MKQNEDLLKHFKTFYSKLIDDLSINNDNEISDTSVDTMNPIEIDTNSNELKDDDDDDWGIYLIIISKFFNHFKIILLRNGTFV
jgi:hypothetical protein